MQPWLHCAGIADLAVLVRDGVIRRRHAGRIEEVLILADALAACGVALALGRNAPCAHLGETRRNRADHAQLAGGVFGDLQIREDREVAHIEHPVALALAVALRQNARVLIERDRRGYSEDAPVEHVAVGKAVAAARNPLCLLLPIVTVLPYRGDHVRAHFLLPSFQYADVGGVCRSEVIGVRTVFELELPVGLIGEGHLPGDQLQPFLALVSNEIEQLGGLAQIVRQRRHIGGQTSEQEPAIAFEARQRGKPMVSLLERRAIAARAV